SAATVSAVREDFSSAEPKLGARCAPGGKVEVDEVAELVGEGLAHLHHRREGALKGLDQLRIVLGARATNDFLARLLDGDGVAVELRAGQRFEGVDDGHRAAAPRDGLALQSLRIAGAIPVLVVCERDLSRELEERIIVLAD